jgi:hypothetical protein
MFKWIKRLLLFFLLLFCLLNFAVYNHAYRLTHFVDKPIPKLNTQAIAQKSFWEKCSLAFMGTENPKQSQQVMPDSLYEAVSIGEHPRLHAWWTKTSRSAKGTVLLFHGYNSNKSSMLNRAQVIRELGYHCFLVDFRGHGDSEGFETSIGYHEAEDVLTAYQHIKTYEKDLPVILLGTSMGAVSVLHAASKYPMDLEKIIIECPFESMYTAVDSRLQQLKLPSLFLADLLLFWGGVQNNMDCTAHRVTDYAKQVKVPTLMIYGQKDSKVQRSEIDHVYEALGGSKQLEIIEQAAHDQLMEDDPKTWTKVVWSFLDS